MILFAQFVLIIWLPVVVGFFLVFPSRKAVVVAYVAAWLGLPPIGFGLPGVPDYTKMTATVAGVLLCMIIFDLGRLLALRFRWFDIPILIWCVGPFFTALSNDLGAYEGSSAMLEQTVNWGFPYLIGRVYFTDLQGMRDLALGIVIGALCVVPCNLLEIRLSQFLAQLVYGIPGFSQIRYGGYCPRVFLSNSLEMGMWMANSSILAYQLWSSKVVTSLRGISFGKLTLLLVATTVLCKATGAILLMLAAITTLFLTRRTKRIWLIMLLMMIPPAYTTTRALNIWSGEDIVQLANSTVGADRAGSYEYRLNMENKLAQRASIRPILGWGRFNRFQVTTEKGAVTTVPDGFWIITLGVQGRVGLCVLLSMMLLPMALTLRRFPISTWYDPQVAPTVGLALLLVIMMNDFLSNAQLNPIYALTVGAVLGQPAVRLGGRRREAEASLAVATDLMIEGRSVHAEHEFRRAIELASVGDDIEGRRVQAESLDGLGHLLLATGRADEAERPFRDALVIRDWIAARDPGPGRFRDLAIAREGLGRALSEAGRTAEAIEERRIALQVWEILASDHPRDTGYLGHRVDALNDLAWMLATDPDPRLRNPALASRMAEEAVKTSGDHAPCWNTLGVARYRAGDWTGAIEALERSATTSPDGLGIAFDHFFLAMAWCRLQHEDRGREWHERGVAWAARHHVGHPALERFREESEALLRGESGLPVPDGR